MMNKYNKTKRKCMKARHWLQQILEVENILPTLFFFEKSYRLKDQG